MKTYIYCLFDINDNLIYVGKTKQLLKTRLKQHIRRLQETVYILELDCVENNQWRFWEEYWIQQFKVWGFDLLNKNKGGGGPEKHSDETKLKISIANKGRKLSQIHIESIRARTLGRKASDETKQLMSQQRKGKIFSDEYRHKLSVAAKQKVFTDKHKANIGKTSLGRKKSDEVKKQISEKLKGIKRPPMSDEQKEKIRQSLLLKSKK